MANEHSTPKTALIDILNSAKNECDDYTNWLSTFEDENGNEVAVDPLKLGYDEFVNLLQSKGVTADEGHQISNAISRAYDLIVATSYVDDEDVKRTHDELRESSYRLEDIFNRAVVECGLMSSY